MSDSSQHPEPGPDRRPAFRPPPADLDLLRSHPSLAPLATRGWQLDRLPTTSLAWAFGTSVLVSLLAFGPGGGVLAVIGIAAAVALAASAVHHRDVVAARVVLRAARAAFLGWLVIAALFTGAGRADGGAVADGRPEASPSVSSSDGVGTRPAPVAGRGGGSGKAGTGLAIGTP